ncbi:MAG: hypothetical protein M3Q65_21935 [Chloroflexota bacterium]|nr:hypothetical protein [Chloroflexota bacterium]
MARDQWAFAERLVKDILDRATPEQRGILTGLFQAILASVRDEPPDACPGHHHSAWGAGRNIPPRCLVP